MKKMLIVFFGNEKLATGIRAVKPVIKEALRSAGFEIEQTITGQLKDLRPHKAKLAVLAAYGRIIPQAVLDEFPLGIINVHPSLLPLHRGPTPIEQTILDGDSKTGVSIMRLTAGMDEGPLYKQKTIHLTGGESKNDLAVRLQQLGAKLLADVLLDIASGKLKPRGQPHPNRATYSNKLSKEDGLIDWTKPAKQLEREIRAYIDWPKSRTTIASKEVVITKAHVVEASGTAGKLQTSDKKLLIYCGQNALEIERLTPVGKVEMTGTSFINGYRL